MINVNRLVNIILMVLILFFLGVANAQGLVPATGGAVYTDWKVDEDGDFYICQGVAQGRRCGKLVKFIPQGRSVIHVTFQPSVSGLSLIVLHVFWK